MNNIPYPWIFLTGLKFSLKTYLLSPWRGLNLQEIWSFMNSVNVTEYLLNLSHSFHADFSHRLILLS